MVQKHNGILLGHKTEHNNVICSNMDGLKLIILSKVSQTETNTWYHLYTERIQMNFSIKEKRIHELQKEIYGYQNGNAGEGIN